MHKLIEQGWVQPRTSLVRAEKGDVICLQKVSYPGIFFGGGGFNKFG